MAITPNETTFNVGKFREEFKNKNISYDGSGRYVFPPSFDGFTLVALTDTGTEAIAMAVNSKKLAELGRQNQDGKFPGGFEVYDISTRYLERWDQENKQASHGPDDKAIAAHAR